MLVLAAILAGVSGHSLLPVLPPVQPKMVYGGLWLGWALSLAGVKLRNVTAIDVLSVALSLVVAGVGGFFVGKFVASLFPAHSAEMYDFRSLEVTVAIWLCATIVLWLRLCDLLARRRNKT